MDAGQPSASRVGPAAECLLAAALFGAAPPASKLLLGSASAPALAGLLYLGAALAVLPAARGLKMPSRRELALVFGIVLCGGVLAPLLLLGAVARASAASASIWLGLETPLTGLLAWGFFREHLGGKSWLAMGLVSASAAMLAWSGGASSGIAALLAFGACACWALDNALSGATSELRPAQLVAIKGTVAGGLNLAAGGFLYGLPVGRTVLAALAVGAVSYGASLLLYLRGARQIGAARAQMLFAAAPLVGAGLSWGFLGEPVRPVELGAAALLALGLGILLSERHSHAHLHAGETHTHAHRHDDAHHTHVHAGLPPSTEHVHEHVHEPLEHAHAHLPDPQHRHGHR